MTLEIFAFGWLVILAMHGAAAIAKDYLARTKVVWKRRWFIFASIVNTAATIWVVAYAIWK